MQSFKFWPVALLLVFVSVTASGCELIADIFQAGVWVGVILVIAVIAGIFFLFKMLVRR